MKEAVAAVAAEWAAPGKKKKRRIFSAVAAAVMLLLLCAALYFGGVLADRDDDPDASFEVVEEARSLAPLREGVYQSVEDVRRAVDFHLIVPDGGCSVWAENASWEGKNAHLVTLTCPSGVTVTAVSPAQAAPLIRRSGMELTRMTDLKVINLDAALAVGRDGACLYFADAAACYCLYGEGMSGEDLVLLASSLTSRNVY